eukprot:6459053-Amphidinium_carterae.2
MSEYLVANARTAWHSPANLASAIQKLIMQPLFVLLVADTVPFFDRQTLLKYDKLYVKIRQNISN